MPFLDHEAILANGVGIAGSNLVPPIFKPRICVLAKEAHRAWGMTPPPPMIFLVSTQDRLTRDSGLDSQIGNPAPSFKLSFGHHRVRLPVKSGTRIVSVDVVQPSATAERPVLRVKSNTGIGLNADVSATASAATNWQTVTLTFVATANGAVVIELENPDVVKPCWFDNLKIQ